MFLLAAEQIWDLSNRNRVLVASSGMVVGIALVDWLTLPYVSLALAHQYLMKPCDAEVLLTTLRNALSLRNILDDPSLTALIGRIRSLPSVPTVYLKLMKAVQSPDTSAAEIGEIVSQDLGLSVKILQWANSPLFGRGRAVAGPKEAAIYLGVETVKAMAATEAVFSQFATNAKSGVSAEELREHSFQVATRAREIAGARRLPQAVLDDVFLGGLLHDIGKLVLAYNFPGQYHDVIASLENPDSLLEMERKVFGATHADVGGYLLWLWGFPEAVTDIVARHHSAGPETDEVEDPAGIVYLADWSVRKVAQLESGGEPGMIGGKVAV